jgi:hypothetical protein
MGYSTGWEELPGSPKVKIVDGKFSAIRRFVIPWNQTIDFAKDLLGFWENDGTDIIYVPPVSFPGFPFAICREFELEPLMGDDSAIVTPASVDDLATNTNQPEYGVVTAQYMVPDLPQKRNDTPNVPEGTYLTIDYNHGQQLQRVPGRRLKWDGTSDLLDEDEPGWVVENTEEISMQWDRVPYQLVPFNKISQFRGCVNSGTFLNHAATTVLFKGAKTKYDLQITGQVLMSLSYMFSVLERPGLNYDDSHTTLYGWHHMLRKDASAPAEGYVKVKHASTDEYLFPTADFNQLFTYGNFS